MRKLIDWLDHRTGHRNSIHEMLYERIPSGARWRYVFGSTLAFCFAVQAITGVFLWMAYSPSNQTAWESVYYIQHEMTGGWLLRGIHHFTAQAMIVLLALHLLQVIIDGAYRAPREINYWLGIVLMKIVLALGLTGYLLPWDQKGYWATNVATNLMTLVPFVGKDMQQIVVGGDAYGHHTLTRFFALHAGILPALLIVFLVLHIALFRRHGITARRTAGRADQYFWPHQVLLDGVACLVVLGVVLLAAINFDFAALAKGELSGATHGAELGAPADPSEQYSAARPEWYFLSLFQLLKYFTSEFVGAIVVPGVLMTVLILAPIIGRWKLGHRFNVAFVFLLLIGAAVLTGLAFLDDSQNKDFKQAKIAAHESAARVKELIHRRTFNDEGNETPPLMTQPEGAVYLLRNDPLSRGMAIFEQQCASCHANSDPVAIAKKEEAEQRLLEEGKEVEADAPPSAPDLYGFASREWLTGLLDPKLIASEKYFGATAHKEGRMVEWVQSHLGDESKISKEDLKAIVAALSAQAKLPAQREADAADGELIARGIELMKANCAAHCHKIGDEGQLGLAPDLTGYGSFEWMMGLVSDPGHARFYRRENDRMPAFAEDLSKPADHALSLREIALVVDYIRGDYFRESDVATRSPRLAHSEEEARLAAALARKLPAALAESPGLVGEEVSPSVAQAKEAERLFVLNCSACHSHVDEFGMGVAAKKPSAPNLYRFASREWIAGLLDPKRIATLAYLGGTHTHAEGEMVAYVNDNLTELDEQKRTQLNEAIAALSAEAALPSQKEADAQAEADGVLERGRTALVETFACTDCHTFRENDAGGGYPVLTGYGSLEWLKGMIADPTHVNFYGESNDRMPRFAGDPNRSGLLSVEEIELVAKWLRGELAASPSD
jgi:ubiquinol-cytochrome c reductase cytochrome b subunit